MTALLSSNFDFQVLPGITFPFGEKVKELGEVCWEFSMGQSEWNRHYLGSCTTGTKPVTWSCPLQGSLGNVVSSCTLDPGEYGFWETASGLCQRQGEWQVQRLRSGSEFGKFREQQGSPCSWISEVGGGGEQIIVETQARPTAKVFSLSCSL